jgi:hypothetical protein
MKQISVATGKFVKKYTLPMGPDIEGKTWRVNTLPHLELYILDESEIDVLINRLLEIRKDYVDSKNQSS